MNQPKTKSDQPGSSSLDVSQKLTELLDKQDNARILEGIAKDVAILLNNLTPQNFESTGKQFHKVIPFMGKDDRIEIAARTVFEAAIKDLHSSKKYADLVHIYTRRTNIVSPGKFHDSIMNLCYLELQYRTDSKSTHAQNKAGKVLTRKEIIEESRNRSIGTLRFLGELFKLNNARRVYRVADCIEVLLNPSSDDNLQDLCELLRMVGKQLEEQIVIMSNYAQINNTHVSMPVDKDWLTGIFDVLRKSSENKSLSDKTRSDLKDLLQLKVMNWINGVVECQGPAFSNMKEATTSKSFKHAFPQPFSQVPKDVPPISFKSSQESISSSKSSASTNRNKQVTPSLPVVQVVQAKPSTKPETSKVKETISGDPEGALVEILKTLNESNVPAVTFKIMALPFEDNYECIYAMTRKMLNKSLDDSSFLKNMQIPIKKGDQSPPPPPPAVIQVEKMDRASSPHLSFIAPIENRDTQTETETIEEDVKSSTDTDRSASVSGSVNNEQPAGTTYGVPCTVSPFPKFRKRQGKTNKLLDHAKTDSDSEIIKNLEGTRKSNGVVMDTIVSSNKSVGVDKPPSSLSSSPPELKYQSMYSNYDRMLQQLPREQAEDLNMEICTLIYNRLKAHQSGDDVRGGLLE